jgi:non-canonical (house-cleaning) NTP pyrophosphatase
MKIGVTSQSGLKLDAVREAYSVIEGSHEIIGASSDSGVGAQPVNGQTLRGAINRIADMMQKVSGLDRIVSIENGIFREDGRWLDKAVVVIYNPRTNKEHIAYSDAVIFPNEYVERTQEIGFDRITVGKVMADAGYVLDAKDPHLSLSGISRQAYLESTLQKLVLEVEKRA